MSVEYPIESYTYGFEIEWGDIDRTLEIPSHLGTWEYAEIDVVNIHEPYKYIAVDPLGIDPPMGGEINTRPSKTWKEQTDLIMEIYQLFVDNGDSPSSSCVNHGHLHVHVPELKNDIDALKRLIKYIKNNQAITIKRLYNFRKNLIMEKMDVDYDYLQIDGGDPMPNKVCDNIINNSKNFDDFIEYHYSPKELQGEMPPQRYAINTYIMQYTNTIEFRCFRSSTNRKHIEDQFRFVEKFMDAALNGGPNVKQILSEYDYEFPPFVFNRAEYIGWQKTIYHVSRGKKHRHYQEVK
jgi:hypothetical protein